MKRLKGIYQSSKEIDQPEGFYYDALNIVIDEKNGSITNEKGNQFKNVLPVGKDEIGVFNPASGTYTTIYSETLPACNAGFFQAVRILDHTLLADGRVVLFFTTDCVSDQVTTTTTEENPDGPSGGGDGDGGDGTTTSSTTSDPGAGAGDGGSNRLYSLVVGYHPTDRNLACANYGSTTIYYDVWNNVFYANESSSDNTLIPNGYYSYNDQLPTTTSSTTQGGETTQSPTTAEPTSGTQIALVFIDGVNFDVTLNGTLIPSSRGFDYTFGSAGVKVVTVSGNITSMALNPNQIKVSGLNNEGFGAFGYKLVNKNADANLYAINANNNGNPEFWGQPASINPLGVINNRSGDTVYGTSYPDSLFYLGWRFDPVNQPNNRTFEAVWSATGKMAITFINYGVNHNNPAI